MSRRGSLKSKPIFSSGENRPHDRRPARGPVLRVTLLYFVRHGESEANVLHVFSNRELVHGLTDTGRAQVQALADQLAGVRFDAFYTSPILRARQSAQIVSDRLGLPFEVTPALAEYDVGILEGRSDEASWRQYDELHTAWVRDGAFDARHPGGESFNDVCAVLLLGHGGTFYCVLSRLCSNIEPDLAFRRGIHHTEIVVVDLQPDGLTCLSWGDTQFSATQGSV